MKRGFEILSFSGASGLLGLGTLHFGEAFMRFGESTLERSLVAGSLLFGATLAAWVLADLLSGVVHFVADNCGTPDTPVFGPILIAPFREHHTSPSKMLEHGFLERNANNALATVPLLVWIPWTSLASPLLLFCAASSVQLSGWILVTNEVHARCHEAPKNGVIKWLQRRGILLSPAQHALHHNAARAARAARAANQATSTAHFHYCITSGFCDRLARSLLRESRTFQSTKEPVP